MGVAHDRNGDQYWFPNSGSEGFVEPGSNVGPAEYLSAMVEVTARMLMRVPDPLEQAKHTQENVGELKNRGVDIGEKTLLQLTKAGHWFNRLPAEQQLRIALKLEELNRETQEQNPENS